MQIWASSQDFTELLSNIGTLKYKTIEDLQNEPIV